MSTRISFLVPTFNRARYLGEALRSILPQMADADELLVIDDGSSDGTAEVVAGLGVRVRYLHQPNAGKAVALNRGMAATSGRYVWICDDDDVLRPGTVGLLFDALERDSAGFAFGRYTRFSDAPDGTRSDLGTGYWPDLSAGSLVRHIFEDAFVMQNAALVRREAYAAVGPFAEAMLRSLDYEMFVRLAASTRSLYVDHILFDQRKHEGVRGPAAMLHAAGSSDNVWQQFDARIFENLHRQAGLGLFEAMFECDDPALLRRAALLQRAAVMARHACWDEALADFAAAAAGSARPLDPGEATICRRAFSGKHLFAGSLDAQAVSALARLSRNGGTGAAIISQAFAGTLWRIRRGSAADRSATLKAMHAVLGMGRSLHLLASHARASTGTAQVCERRDLPEAAFLPAHALPPVAAWERKSAA